MPRIRLPWTWNDQDAGAFATRVYASRFVDQKGWKVAEVSADDRAAEFDIDEGAWWFSVLRVWVSGAEDDWQAPGAPRIEFNTDTLLGQTSTGAATAEPANAAAALVDSSLEARVAFDAPTPSDPPAKVQVIEGASAETGRVLAEVEAMPAGPLGADYGRQVSAAFPAEGRPDAAKTLTLRAISRAGVPSSSPVTVTVRTPPLDQFHEVALVNISGATHTGMPTPASTDAFEYDGTDGLRLKTWPADGSSMGSDYGDGTTGMIAETEFGAILCNSAKVESDELDVGAVCTFRLSIVDTVARKSAAGLIGALDTPLWWLVPDPVSDVDLRVARNSPLWLARETYTGGSPRQPLRECRWEYVISDSSSVSHADSDYRAYVPGMIVRGRYLRVRLVLYEPTGAHQIICPTASVTAQLIRTPVVIQSGTPEASLTRPPGMLAVDSDTGAVYAKASGLGNAGWKSNAIALRETGGPTVLAVGAVADGQAVERSGSTLVGRTRATIRVTFASTANVDTTSAPGTIDAASASAGDIILLRSQSTPSQNGVWIHQGTGNAMTRDPRFPAGDPIPVDVAFWVRSGTTQYQKLYGVVSVTTDVIGTDNWTMLEIAPPTTGSVPTGTGFRHVTGGAEDATAQFEPDTDGTLAANSDTKLATQKATRTYADTGDAAVAGLFLGNRFPQGLLQDPAIVATAMTTLSSHAVYIGKAPKANPTVNVVCEVRTAYAAAGGTTWAEVVVATGAFAANAGPTLTARGTTSVAATFNATGTKQTSVSTSGIAVGDDLWVVFGSRTLGTCYQILGAIPDRAQHGIACNLAATQPSGLSASAMTLAAVAYVPPWFSAVLS